ncbi:MAG: metal-sulfur cluster assembly factor [Candidatus Aenigmarchaeota archaeon]|nr:metal-sulfur cluster assembly factor [Candidatus Aenigmarchaeota archaeon]
MVTEKQVWEALKEVKDPELDIDVVTLGLIYEVKVEGEKAKIKMTFTSPFCPYGQALVEEVKQKAVAAGVKDAEVEIVFDPPWEPSAELKATLGVG